jgi:hypothetical protein
LEKVLPVPEQNYSKNSTNKSPYINPISKIIIIIRVWLLAS